MVESNTPVLQNDFVTCYTDHLVIHLYYFPFGEKKIAYREIKSCDMLPIDQLGFLKIKTWGMALAPIWWHCDLRRHLRQSCIVLDANQWPKIGLTMNDDDDIKLVYHLIKQRLESDQVLPSSSDKPAEKTPY